MKKSVTFYVNEALYEKFRKYTVTKGITQGAAIEAAIEKFLASENFSGDGGGELFPESIAVFKEKIFSENSDGATFDGTTIFLKYMLFCREKKYLPAARNLFFSLLEDAGFEREKVGTKVFFKVKK